MRAIYTFGNGKTEVLCAEKIIISCQLFNNLADNESKRQSERNQQGS